MKKSDVTIKLLYTPKRQFILIDEHEQSRVLLELGEKTENISNIATDDLQTMFGTGRQNIPLMQFLPEMGQGKFSPPKMYAYIATLFLLVNVLRRHASPVDILRISGVADDAFTAETAKLLDYFDAKHRLYTVSPLGVKTAVNLPNVTPLSTDLDNLLLPRQRFVAVIVEDSDAKDCMTLLNAATEALKPNGRIICLDSRGAIPPPNNSLTAAWQRRFKDSAPQVLGGCILDTCIVSAEDCLSETTQQKRRIKEIIDALSRRIEKADTPYELDLLAVDAEHLGKCVRDADCLSSADAPYFVNRLKEAIIDCRLGFVPPTDMTDALARLKEEIAVDYGETGI